MKKIISYIAAAVLAIGTLFTFAACGEDPVTVTGIEVTKQPTKTEYILGEKFEPAGMEISKLLSNETKEALASTEYTYSPSGALKLSDKKVTVTYENEGQSYTATVNIKVTNEVSEVKIITEPDKKEYITGELFDPTGMTIQAVLQDGTEDSIVEVSEDTVTYKTTRLIAEDSHFEMNYGGYTFYYDMTVKCGAVMEAEAGLIITSGVSVGAAPNKVAVEADMNNLAGKTGDGTPFVRGIDKGLFGTDPNGNQSKITESRVDVRNYIFDPNDPDYTYMDFCATGGGNVASLAPEKNIMEFDRTGTGSVLYALTADRAGKVDFTLRMTVTDPDQSYHAVETKLNEVLEITVNGTKVTIADTVVIPEVDFTDKKSYTPSTTELSTLGDIKGTFDNTSKLRTNFCWQNVTVPIDMIEGGNSIIIKSLITTKKDMRIDSVSFDGDKSKVSLFNESAFAPEVKSAKLKVENDKVYMGVVVDPKAVGYDESAILTVLGLTKVKGTNSCTWANGGDSNINTNGSSDKNDPWTSPTSYGGLGYTEPPLLQVHSMGGNWKDKVNERGITVEKITSGEFANCYYVWFEVTIPEDSELGTDPDKNRYIGAAYFTGFTYGSDYANSHPAADILKDGDSTFVNNGDYCYQVFCDTRDKHAGFYAGNEINLILVVQHGTFDESKQSETLPLRNKLMRRYVSHFADNDAELIEQHK